MNDRVCTILRRNQASLVGSVTYVSGRWPIFRKIARSVSILVGVDSLSFHFLESWNDVDGWADIFFVYTYNERKKKEEPVHRDGVLLINVCGAFARRFRRWKPL